MYIRIHREESAYGAREILIRADTILSVVHQPKVDQAVDDPSLNARLYIRTTEEAVVLYGWPAGWLISAGDCVDQPASMALLHKLLEGL